MIEGWFGSLNVGGGEVSCGVGGVGELESDAE